METGPDLLMLRILNLEDNPNDAELNEVELAKRWPDCRLVRVCSRDGYIAALVQPDIDVILSDYSMPGFDGQSALALAREKCPQIPFLFVSGTIGEEAAIDALRNGATDYVLKHRLLRLAPAVDRALREAAERSERQRAEEAMRESEHKYRELFECLGDPAFLTDERSGKIIDTNRRALELIGCAREEIIGHKQSQFLVAVTPSRSPFAMRTPGLPNYQLHSTGGRRISVDVRATHLTLYGRALVLSLCREIIAPTSG
jgi:PAS domain S-box-containing protein